MFLRWAFNLIQIPTGSFPSETHSLVEQLTKITCCVPKCASSERLQLMNLWLCLTLTNLPITKSLPAVCHWIQVINLLNGARTRLFHSKPKPRASGGQLFSGLLLLQLVSEPGSWGQEAIKEKLEDKSSFGSGNSALDLLHLCNSSFKLQEMAYFYVNEWKKSQERLCV